MNNLNYYLKNWYYFGAILFVILAYLIAFFGDIISPLQKILTLSFMALLVHQFEEYAYPGGFPAIFNRGMLGEKEVPNRYPLNQKSCLLANVIGGYTFYISAIIFSNQIWLGITQILFGMAQFLIHGIVINVKMKTFYNPGLAAVVFLHWPIGIYYIWYIITNGLGQPLDWIVGIGCTPIAAILIIALPVILLKDKKSKYTYSKEEMERFHMKEKLEKLTTK